MSSPLEVKELYIKILSPVHIGTGEVYEPTTFFVDEENQRIGLINFEKLCFHMTEEEMKRFSSYCMSGKVEDLAKLYGFVDNVCSKLISSGKSDFLIGYIPTTPGFIGHYRDFKRLPPNRLRHQFNRFTIMKTYKPPYSLEPVIPGSSIKGAIRTAVLNLLRDNVKGENAGSYRERRGYNSKKLEQKILGFEEKKLHEDPFSRIKVSDFLPVKASTRIVYAVNVKKNSGSGSGPPQILEVIEPGSVFQGTIEVFEAKKCKLELGWSHIEKALSQFYRGEFDKEVKILTRIGGADAPRLPEKGLLLRLGKHSGAECVTIEGFRRIKIRTNGTYEGESTTTIWLSSESKIPLGRLLPFGWACITEDPEDKPQKREKYSESFQLSQDLIEKLREKFRVVKK